MRLSSYPSRDFALEVETDFEVDSSVSPSRSTFDGTVVVRRLKQVTVWSQIAEPVSCYAPEGLQRGLWYVRNRESKPPDGACLQVGVTAGRHLLLTVVKRTLSH